LDERLRLEGKCSHAHGFRVRFRRLAAVLLLSAGMLGLLGLPAGPVRLPLVDSTPAEIAVLRADCAAGPSVPSRFLGKPMIRPPTASELSATIAAMLFGLLFLVPFLGLAIGAAWGALFGKLGKTGIDQKVLQEMGDAVPAGKAGWFLLIGQMTEDKFLAAVQGTGAKLVRSNLTEAQEKELKHAFGARKHEK